MVIFTISCYIVVQHIAQFCMGADMDSRLTQCHEVEPQDGGAAANQLALVTSFDHPKLREAHDLRASLRHAAS